MTPNTSAFKVFCMILLKVADGEDWTLVFKIATGGAGNVYDLYTGTGTLNVGNASAQSLTQPIRAHYKSDIVNKWSTEVIEQVRVSVYKNSTEVAFLMFDGQGSDKMNWFSIERLVSSSYSDLIKSSKTCPRNPPINVFSITGLESNFFRRFYINSNWGGCGVDFDWLIVSDIGSTSHCVYENRYFNHSPAILYSPYPTGSKFDIEQDNILAESLAVFVKFPVDSVTTIKTDVATNAGIDFNARITQLRQELTIDKKNTSRFKNSVTSVYEDRMSAKTIGALGVSVIAGVVGLLVLIDCINWKQHWRIHNTDTN